MPSKIEKFLRNQGRQDLVETLRESSPDALKRKLMEQAEHEQAIIDTKNNDEELKNAKDHARSLGSVYNEQIRMNKKISRFVHLLLNDK
jgi:hypothetical protein